jgi:hypothetical protein
MNSTSSLLKKSLNKAETDRAINRWFLTSLLSPTCALSFLAFFIGYLHPEVAQEVKHIAAQFGIEGLISLRAQGTNFDLAAFFYWISIWVLIPINVTWMYMMAVRHGTALALRTATLRSLRSRALDPRKYTLRWGYLRFFGGALLSSSLFVVQLMTAHEPSFCKGCESESWSGFLLINWFVTQVLLMGTYGSCSYLYFWRSIQKDLGESNE